VIDLHNHLLPGLDDGAPDWDETLRMARRAWEDGIRVIAATPHLIWGRSENAYDRVQKLAVEAEGFLKEHGVPLRIIPGTELPSKPETLDLLRKGKLPTLGANRCVLFEPPFGRPVPEFETCIKGILEEGYRLLLAHPERCRFIQERPDLILQLLPPDTPLQITSHSLMGEFGPAAYETALWFLTCGRPALIASDSHSSTRRAPVLSPATKIAAAIVGEETALRMVTELPQAFLDGLPPFKPG
jgi:protein-tyrosine phosphatase